MNTMKCLITILLCLPCWGYAAQLESSGVEEMDIEANNYWPTELVEFADGSEGDEKDEFIAPTPINWSYRSRVAEWQQITARRLAKSSPHLFLTSRPELAFGLLTAEQLASFEKQLHALEKELGRKLF